MTTIRQPEQTQQPDAETPADLLDAVIAATDWPDTLPAEAQDPSVLLAQHAAHPFAFDYVKRLARWIVDAGMAPKSFKGRPEGVAIAMLHGSRLGLDPLSSVQSIAVVNGMPTVFGDALPALLKNAGARIEETLPEEFGEDAVALCVVTTPDGQRVERRFTWQMAQKARLLGKEGPWRDYPLRMLQMRARAWACRDAMPEVLKGFGVDEEQQDVAQTPVATLVETPHGEAIVPTVDGLLPTTRTESDTAADVLHALAAMHFEPDEGAIWLDKRAKDDPGTFRVRIGDEWRPVTDADDNLLRVMIEDAGDSEKEIRDWAVAWAERQTAAQTETADRDVGDLASGVADGFNEIGSVQAGTPEDEDDAEPVKEVDLGAEAREPKLWETRSRRKPKNAKPGDMWRNEADGTTQVLDIDGEWFLPANAREAAEWLCSEIADAQNAGQEPRSFRKSQEATEPAPSEDEEPPQAAPVSEEAPAPSDPGGAQADQIEGPAAELQHARDRFKATRARLKLEHTDVAPVVEALIERPVESMAELSTAEILSVIDELELRHG